MRPVKTRISLGSLAILGVHSEDSDWADAQADLILRWAHRSFCWLYRAVAQLIVGHTKALPYL